MPLDAYGVLKAKAVARRREGSTGTPHYQVLAVDSSGTSYRLAVNVKSMETPSELLYLVDDDVRHPVTGQLEGLASGWHALAPQPGSANLDFVRGNLFDPAGLRTLPPDVAGPDNDLADVLDRHITRAIDDPAAEVYAFGERWGPEGGSSDKVFGFRPGNGVHDIHMNQGNSPQFQRDDGVWQDGGLLLRFPGAARWVGVFLAFQSQAWHTDDATGHAIAGAPPRRTTEPSAIRILASMVNPAGPAPERETVLLLNTSPKPVDLTGWQIADRLAHTCSLPAGPLAPGATLQAPVSPPAQLGNKGGTITLLDAHGLKVAGASYTAEQAQREGWTIVF